MSAEDAWTHVALIRAAEDRELRCWSKLQIFETVKQDKSPKAIADTRRVLRRKMVDGRWDAKGRLVAKGRRRPDWRVGLAGTPRCASLRSADLQAIFLSWPKDWKLRSLDTKNAFLLRTASTVQYIFARPPSGALAGPGACGDYGPPLMV